MLWYVQNCDLTFLTCDLVGFVSTGVLKITTTTTKKKKKKEKRKKEKNNSNRTTVKCVVRPEVTLCG